MNLTVRFTPIALLALCLASAAAGCGGGGKKNRAPDAVIIDPHESSTHFPATNVDFDGRATDPEDGAVPAANLRWEVYNAQDQIVFASPGANVTAQFPTIGEYTVILYAADSHGREGRAITTMKIGNTVAELTNPGNHDFVGISTPFDVDADVETRAPGTVISLMTFKGVDQRNDAIVFTLPVAASTAVCNAALTICSTRVTPSVPAGPYLITVDVTTSVVAEVAKDTLYVIADSPPVVAITSPVDGSRVAPGTAIAFSATASDPGGDVLTYLWTSSYSGDLGSNQLSFSRSDLAVSKHQVTFTATDVNGQSSSATVDLYIEDPADPLFATVAGITDVHALAPDGSLMWFGRGNGTGTPIASATTDLLVVGTPFASAGNTSVEGALFVAPAGERWFALDGSGVDVLTPGASPLKDAVSPLDNNVENLQDDRVLALAQSPIGSRDVYIATDAGLDQFGTNHVRIAGTPGGGPYFAVGVDATGSVWAGTDGNGLERFAADLTPSGTFTQANGLADDVVRAIAFDAAGNVWIGTDGGLSRYVPGTNVITSWRNGFPNDTIHSIAVDAAGIVWLGTGIGAVRFDPATDRRMVLDQVDLGGRVVRAVAIDATGAKWFGTQTGGPLNGALVRYKGP